jgi:hypothetical protein
MTRIRLVAAAGTALAVLIVAAGCGGGRDVTEQEILLDIEPVGSGTSTGTLSLSKSGETTNVVVDFIVPSGGGQQDASFYQGTCENFDESSEIEVGPLEEGTGAVTLDTPIDTLLDGGYVLIVHKAVDDPTPIGCATIDVE